MPDWVKHEAEVNEALGLEPTISSGSKWHDIGDGVHRGEGRKFPMVVDAKSTDHESFTLKHKDLSFWWKRAKESGRVFGLPVRFDRFDEQKDWVVLEFNEYCQILAAAEEETLEVRPRRDVSQKQAFDTLWGVLSKIQNVQVRSDVLNALMILEEAVPE